MANKQSNPLKYFNDEKAKRVAKLTKAQEGKQTFEQKLADAKAKGYTENANKRWTEFYKPYKSVSTDIDGYGGFPKDTLEAQFLSNSQGDIRYIDRDKPKTSSTKPKKK